MLYIKNVIVLKAEEIGQCKSQCPHFSFISQMAIKSMFYEFTSDLKWCKGKDKACFI